MAKLDPKESKYPAKSFMHFKSAVLGTSLMRFDFKQVETASL